MNSKVRVSLLPPVLAVVFSVLLSSVVLLIAGKDPVQAFGVMLTQIGHGTTAVDIVNLAGTYYLAAVAVAIGFQMNLFNIGVEGQYRMAVIAAGVVAGGVVLPFPLHVLLALVAAMVTGALWAAIPAVLKVTRGVSEVISSIMLNSIALGGFSYLLSVDVFGVRTGDKVATPPIPDSGRVPGISLGGAGTLYGLLVVSVLVGIGYWVVMNRTRLGFEVKASGESPTAATAGGVSATRLVLIAMLTSGAVAGLTGLPELLGRTYEVAQNFPSGYGFTGIAIALLGRNHPVGVAIGALLWAFLDRSALALDNIDVPQELAIIMQAIIVISVLVAYQVIRRWNLAAQQRQVGSALAAGRETPASAEKSGATSGGAQ